MLGALKQDLGYAHRQLRRSPGFAAVALLTLALGIGANTTIFSAVNAVILRPLPFRDPGRLYMLAESNPDKGWVQAQVAPANMLDWKEQVRGFSNVAGYQDFPTGMTLTGRGAPQPLTLSVVTGNFFDVLGVRPELGRALRPAETWRGTEPVIVLTHSAWRLRFGGDPSILGRMITLDGQGYRVVGVMPRSLAFPYETMDGWIPEQWDPAYRSQVFFRRAHWLRAIARLAPGATATTANQELQAVVTRLQGQYPETNRVMGANMTPLHRYLVGDERTPLLVLLGAVGLLLLIACANVGNLLLVRISGRRRELAVRSALGAGRWRLGRQLLTESLVLSALGGLGGILVGWLGTRALEGLQPHGLLRVSHFAFDLRVLAFVAASTAVAGALFGAAPVLWTGRRNLGSALRERSLAAGSGGGSPRLAGGLVVGEVALALLLVVGAGLLVRSFQRLQRVDAGFDPHGVLEVTLNLPSTRYDTREKVNAFWSELLRRVGAMPGVTDASATSVVPLSGRSGWTSDASVAGRPPDAYVNGVAHREVAPGYFRTMGVPVLRGRSFTEADDPSGTRVVVINQTLARQYFRGQDPIGQRICFDQHPDSTSVWRTIVGVVGDERQSSVALGSRIEIIAPYYQAQNTNRISLLARSTGNPAALVPAIRRAVSAMDPELPLLEVRTMDEVHSASLARQRFMMTLLLLFAAIALVLAVVGVYGVVAQTERQRTREIGIRIALGARAPEVVRLVLRRGAVLILAGLAVGLIAALLVTRAMRSLLYGVAPTDLPTFAAVTLVLAAAGLLATWIPARRAARVDPVRALRSE